MSTNQKGLCLGDTFFFHKQGEDENGLQALCLGLAHVSPLSLAGSGLGLASRTHGKGKEILLYEQTVRVCAFCHITRPFPHLALAM